MPPPTRPSRNPQLNIRAIWSRLRSALETYSSRFGSADVDCVVSRSRDSWGVYCDRMLPAGAATSPDSGSLGASVFGAEDDSGASGSCSGSFMAFEGLSG